jgi:uncharacterized protein (DUF2267 family)
MSHEYDAFIGIVQRHARLSFKEAERAAQAVLETLAERLSPGQARDVAQHLPPEMRGWLSTATDAEGFDAAEFVRRVARRAGVDDLAEAERQTRAVFDALQRLVPEGELADMESELSHDYAALVAPIDRRSRDAAPVPLPAEDFLRRVADHAATDVDTARRAAVAVLETLGERLARGEVRDLAAQLPPEVRPALERGDEATHGAARRMSLDEFLWAVAEREGADRQTAADHARAVFATLREAVTVDELADVMAQLPKEYVAIAAGT